MIIETYSIGCRPNMLLFINLIRSNSAAVYCEINCPPAKDVSFIRTSCMTKCLIFPPCKDFKTAQCKFIMSCARVLSGDNLRDH